MNQRLQRGQALVLIALAFIGLAAFVGLAVDAGILFSSVGHLRRAVDAAALAGANQFREGRDPDELNDAADEFIALNNLDNADADVFLCVSANQSWSAMPGYAGWMTVYHDPLLCPPTIGPNDRKFVRVEATYPVQFAFLPIIGWDSVNIGAEAIAEAASLDMVLAIDTSGSMAFDLCHDGLNNDADWDPAEATDPHIDDCTGNDPPNGKFGMYSEYEPWGSATPGLIDGCNDEHARIGTGPYIEPNDCHPFEEVREAADLLLTRMNYPYDRLSIVTFDSVGHTVLDLPAGTTLTAARSALGSLSVSSDPPCSYATTHDPRGCTNTNTQEGLYAAGSQFGNFKRDEAVWIVILLSDGGANAARDDATPPEWICPGGPDVPTWVTPFCRDADTSSRHVSTNALYDADDAARDAADWVGCPDSNSFPPIAPTIPPGCAAQAPGGQGAVIFTIALGDLTVENECDIYYSDHGLTCDPDLGEQLMRYVAAVGDDNNPTTDACASTPSEDDCGNYYFSPTGAGLMDVFEALASRIFTRITH